jgi:DNA-binding NarL/FixJ family response regulator
MDENKRKVSPRMVNVFLVHEMGLINNVMLSVLEDEDDVDVVGYTTSTEEALGTIADGKEIDVLLVSSHLPENGSVRLIQEVNERKPACEVVVIGLTETREEVLHYLEAGASNYVAKDSTLDEMITAIHMAERGEAAVPPDITAALMDRLSEYANIFSGLEMSVVDKAGLTPREMEVLELLGQELTNTDIADTLYIEVGTVKNHVHSILKKLNVSSREEAASYLALLQR